MPRVGQGLDTISSNSKKDTENFSIVNHEKQNKIWSETIPKPGPETGDNAEYLENQTTEKILEEAHKMAKEAIIPDIMAEDDDDYVPESHPVNENGGDSDSGTEKDLDGLEEPDNVKESGNEEEDINENDSQNEARNLGGSRHQSFSFLAQKKSQGENNRTLNTSESNNEEFKAIQRDVNHIFSEIDTSTEFTLITMCSISAMLAFSEILNDQETFEKAYMIFKTKLRCKLAHELSMDFISNTLRNTWALLNIEIPSEVSMATLRDMRKLGESFKRLAEVKINHVY